MKLTKKPNKTTSTNTMLRVPTLGSTLGGLITSCSFPPERSIAHALCQKEAYRDQMDCYVRKSEQQGLQRSEK